ncbi:MAG: hypothetical protein LC135_01930 [Phycisphaerae bacterium]|nr:hypothetical protein [Phycisphaerae bacterium]MCZ2398613.1 hypothetical protein [Phycisphaerae bacterium]
MTPAEVRALSVKLRRLDRVRTRLAELAQRDEQLTAEAIVLMRQQRLEHLNFSATRSVALVTKQRTTVAPEAFRRAALEANLSDEQIDQALSESVRVTEARKLLGDERLEAIAESRPGKPELRFSGGAARAGSRAARAGGAPRPGRAAVGGAS